MRNEIVVRGACDARVAAIAACQRGRVRRVQLLAAGLSASQITRRVRSGALYPRHAGVYAVGHPSAVPLGAETEALLALRDGALLADASAARLWGLDAIDVPASVHVLVDARFARAPAGVRVHRSRTIAAPDRRLRAGLPIVSPARALLDLAAAGDGRRLERAHDQALVTGVMRPRDVAELVRRCGRHPGARRLRDLHAAGAGAGPTITRSQAEARMLALIDGAGLPRPRVNARLHGVEVDFHWPQARLVVEVDGYRFHATRARFERDRARDATLTRHGFTVLRFTWRQLTGDPVWVAVQLAAALARSDPSTGMVSDR